MKCRVGCGACCIALSISSPIPGLPGGKPAGLRCVQLTLDSRCRLFGQPERPAVCQRLRPSEEMYGRTAQEALALLAQLELATKPDPEGFGPWYLAPQPTGVAPGEPRQQPVPADFTERPLCGYTP